MSSPSRIHVTVGAVVAETYRLEALIGKGGMGEVYAASHLRLPGKQVAIKFLHPEVSDPEILARFRREAEIASRLGHPNIVGVLDFNSLPDGTPYLVLEYLVGETLADAISRGPLPLERTFSIARQVGSALAAAHRAGVVHRDLKPQNIFLVPTEIDGRIGENAKILDFGISKIRGSQTVKTQDSALLGTPQYMAPEQAMGQHDSVDGRTDIFALGAILYEMLTGQSAFAGASIPEVVFKVVYEAPAPLADRAPGVPAHVVAAIERAMAKKADERFATVGDLIVELTGVGLATLPPSASVPELRSPGRKVDSAAAHAQTMGSGDHAAAMAATSAGFGPATASSAGLAPMTSPAGAGAPMTSPAGAGAPMTAGGPAVAAAPTAYERPRPSGPAPSASPPAGAPSALRWKVAAAAFATIAAGAAAYLVVRGLDHQNDGATQIASGPTAPLAAAGSGGEGPTPPATAPTTSVTPPPDAAAANGGPDAGVAPGSALDAATPPAADAGAPRDAATGSRPPHTKPRTPPPPPVPEEPEATGELGEKLAKAWKQVEAGNLQTAKTLANSIIDDPAADEHVRRQANQVIVLIACRSDDRETAVRAAKRARILRPKVIAQCAAHDIELPRRGR